MSDLQPAYHAVLGPSSAHRWRKCSASVKASSGFADDAGDAARMGTACHGASAEILQGRGEPLDFLGRKFVFAVDPFGNRYEDFAEVVAGESLAVVQHEFVFADEHIEFIDAYVRFVREQHALLGGELFVEQRVSIEHITGEKGGAGTSDVFIVAPPTLYVIDAKFGRNRVTAYEQLYPSLPHPLTDEMMPPVYEPNDQLALYAGGALEAQRLFHDFDTVKLIIVQPPINSVSEFSISVEGLDAHLDQVRIDAEATRSNPTFVVGDHCTHCRARLSCVERDKAVIAMALEGFTDATDAEQISRATLKSFEGNYLGTVYGRIGEIEQWCEDIRRRVFNELNAGGNVTAPDGSNFKLVAGKKGRRQWRDAATAEEMLKTMRLKKDEMFNLSLISPTDAEKLAKQKKNGPAPLIGERQWIKLQREITQPDPKPTVVHGSDPRPVYSAAVDGFTDSSSPTPGEDADLF